MRLVPLRRVTAVGAATLIAFGGLGALTATPAFAATSQVSVVHGIPGQNVDVYVNGKKTLPDFAPGKVAISARPCSRWTTPRSPAAPTSASWRT
jgi:hypothetical protein